MTSLLEKAKNNQNNNDQIEITFEVAELVDAYLKGLISPTSCSKALELDSNTFYSRLPSIIKRLILAGHLKISIDS